jgi:pimeloyl-ACP methyl ester carboxylesterase
MKRFAPALLLGRQDTPEFAQQAAHVMRQRAEALRADFRGTMKAMVKMLFHADADASLVAEVERRMLQTSPEVAYTMLRALVDYDYRVAVRKLMAPVRAINGDLFPTDVQAIRKVRADFDAVVMPHAGHYPMLERPEEFNHHVAQIAEDLEKRKPAPRRDNP